ncbi:Rha family transcriptional regulator [Levilactobacillus brevis]|uniref:Rha family transcriptional regulator n=1 Tax=Levilactobacillus brevis TaxID=1580 RepID=UPI000761E704|nr:Rha family transcriptional regulator [Levilactobacillus brevis]KWU40597.1 repressor [Levilactobacillus brevis]MCT3577481.1 phage regulatory protein [Levilactobacillus brevis]MDM5047022.1 Rha family transcriptional regulator [Levilactobacillus brevis]
MNDLVFLSSQQVDAEPFTTGDVIAEYAGIARKSVNELIRRYKDDLEDFGVLPFEMAKPIKGSLGGHPRRVWYLNKNQANLLITYLDNTKPVRQFKKALVRQFDAMQRELIERRAQFELGKRFSKSLHATIADSQIKMHGHEYSTFNRLIYKQALGVDSTKLRKARDIPKSEAITTYLSSDEAEAVRLVKNRVEVLLDVGMDYQQIKQALQIKGVVYKVTLQLPVKN